MAGGIGIVMRFSHFRHGKWRKIIFDCNSSGRLMPLHMASVNGTRLGIDIKAIRMIGIVQSIELKPESVD